MDSQSVVGKWITFASGNSSYFLRSNWGFFFDDENEMWCQSWIPRKIKKSWGWWVKRFCVELTGPEFERRWGKSCWNQQWQLMESNGNVEDKCKSLVAQWLRSSEMLLLGGCCFANKNTPLFRITKNTQKIRSKIS
jgi:hypothetical protein